MSAPTRRPLASWPVLIAASGALATLVSLSGCGATRVDRFTIDPPSGAAQLALDIDNDLGGVEIRVDPTAPRVRVEATKRIRGRMPREERDVVFDAIDVYPDFEAPPDRRGVMTLTVESTLDDPAHSADLYIVTPRCDGVRVNSAGDVLLVGVGGAIEVENRRGTVDVRTARPVTQPVALVTGAGDVFLQIPPESTAEFDLQAPQGRARFRSTLVPLLGASYSAHRVIGVLNEGGNPVMLRSGDGNVTVIVLERPEETVR